MLVLLVSKQWNARKNNSYEEWNFELSTNTYLINNSFRSCIAYITLTKLSHFRLPLNAKYLARPDKPTYILSPYNNTHDKNMYWSIRWRKRCH